MKVSDVIFRKVTENISDVAFDAADAVFHFIEVVENDELREPISDDDMNTIIDAYNLLNNIAHENM